MSQTQYSYEVIDVDGKRHQVKSLNKALLFNDSALVKVFNGYKLVKVISVSEIKKETKMMFPNTLI